VQQRFTRSFTRGRFAAAPRCVVLRRHGAETDDPPRVDVRHLRQKLGDDPAATRVIATGLGIGHRLLMS